MIVFEIGRPLKAAALEPWNGFYNSRQPMAYSSALVQANSTPKGCLSWPRCMYARGIVWISPALRLGIYTRHLSLWAALSFFASKSCRPAVSKRVVNICRPIDLENRSVTCVGKRSPQAQHLASVFTAVRLRFLTPPR